MTKFEFAGLILIAVTIVGALGALEIHSNKVERKAWEEFSKQHNCEVIGSTKAQSVSGFGVTANGNAAIVTSHIPKQTIYRCDDGTQYIR